jgi:hypothetical protein
VNLNLFMLVTVALKLESRYHLGYLMRSLGRSLAVPFAMEIIVLMCCPEEAHKILSSSFCDGNYSPYVLVHLNRKK